VYDGEPLDESILRSRRWFSFALAKRSHDSDDYIRGYPLRRVEVFDQSRDTCLVEFCFEGGDLYNSAQCVFVQAVFKRMAADGINNAGDLDASLLRWDF
jgi:hypothetical protein